MKVEFKDKKLETIAGDEPVTWLPVNVIHSVRRKLTILACAKDERDLVNFKSLHYEKLKGDKKGFNSIRVNKKWRIVFTLDESSNPHTVRIVSIEDYHK